MKTVFQYGGPSPFKGCDGKSLIQVEQREDRHGRFKVTYGLQVRDGLTYVDAAKELGLCIFHHLACEGELENGEGL